MTVLNDVVLKAVAELAFPDNTLAQLVFWFLTDFVANQDDNDVVDAIEQYVDDFLTPIAGWIPVTVTNEQGDVSEMEWDAVNSVWETTRLVGLFEQAVTFTSVAELLPFQSAPVIVGNTARPKSRGRKFIPGFTENAQVATELISGALTNLGTSLNVYLADESISAGNELIVGVASTVTGTFLPFTDGAVNSLLGTQRRRKPGVGA